MRSVWRVLDEQSDTPVWGVFRLTDPCRICGVFRGPFGSFQVNFKGRLYVSETIPEQLIVPFSGEDAQWFQHLLTRGLCA